MKTPGKEARHLVSAARLAVLFVFPGLSASAQPRQVLDMRYPPRGVIRFVEPSVRWGLAYELPSFAGDVDGDGYGDYFLFRKTREALGVQTFTRLVYGSASFPPEVSLPAARQTRFLDECVDESAEQCSGVYAWSSNLGPVFGPASDVDGDGYDDFLVVSTDTVRDGTMAGIVLLVFGGRELPEEVRLGDLSSAGIRSARFVENPPADHYFGVSSVACGDLNGDGKADLAFGAVNAPGTEDGLPEAGRLYVVYGGFPLEDEIDVSRVTSDLPGFVLYGAYGGDNSSPIAAATYGDWLGRGIVGAGDLNGDGFDDLLVSASTAKRRGLYRCGAVYVVYGGPSIPKELLAAAPEEFGVEFQGAEGFDEFGHAIAAAGDVDGDGLSDFVVGAPLGSYYGRGKAYVIFGSADWPSQVRVDDPGLRVFSLRQGALPRPWAPVVAQEDFFGGRVFGLGDWNGDGFSDVYVGAPHEEVRFGTWTGAGYIVFGGPWLPRTASEDEVGTPELPGLVLLGPKPTVQFGCAGDARGDIDGDGSRELLLAAALSDSRLPPEDFQVYVLPSSILLAGRRLDAVLPSVGPLEGGVRVSLHGSGFRGDEEVFFGGVRSEEVEVRTSAEISVLLPPSAAPGAVDVKVVGSDGEAELGGGFTYMVIPYPDIVLDVEVLRASGYRTFEYSDFLLPRYIYEYRGIPAVHFGDLDGDSLDELFVGRLGEPSWGAAVVFGGNPLPPRVGPGETMPYRTVFVQEADTWPGTTDLAFPGDVDGDGEPDLAIGSAYELLGGQLSESGRVYMVYGRPVWGGEILIEEEIAAGRAAVVRHERCGPSFIACPGDMEGLGRPSLVVALGYSCRGEAAEAWLFLDGLKPEDLAAGPSTVITGDPSPVEDPVPGDHRPRFFGCSVSAAGDTNGDGLADFLVGADKTRYGEAFLVLGGAFERGRVSINDLEAWGRAVRFQRRDMKTFEFGFHVAGVGDFNGDGLSDVALGDAEGGRDFAGEVHIVFGSREFGKSARRIDLSGQGPGRLRIDGVDSYDWQGGVSGIGDWNRDGFADVCVWGPHLFSRRSRAYVVFGRPDPPERLDLVNLGAGGFRILCKEGNWTMMYRTPMNVGAGDLDGDGFVDLAIPESTPSGYRVLVVYGGRESEAMFIRGDSNSDGKVDLSDAVATLGYLFLGASWVWCLDAADANDDGEVNITDAIFLLEHLFLGGEALPAPYPEAGIDPTADELRCWKTR